MNGTKALFLFCPPPERRAAVVHCHDSDKYYVPGIKKYYVPGIKYYVPGINVPELNHRRKEAPPPWRRLPHRLAC
jgi:hypothetical protein